VTPDELERAAREVLPRELFEFIASGARDELTLAANLAAWRAHWLIPRLLVDVASVNTATEVLGQPIELPLLAAPMSVLGLVHPDGDLGLVRATAAAGTIAVVSQTSLTPLDALAAVSGGRFWAAHYPLADRQVEEEVVMSAVAAGAGAIVVTLDLPLNADTRARPAEGFVFPPPDHFPPRAARGHALRTSLTSDYIAWLRELVPPAVPLVAKGVLRASDAVLLADLGVSAIIVSNHGGRTLDGALPSATALAEVSDAVNQRVEVYVDGGLRRGADVLRALALGARAVLLGRPLAWGLACGGEAGVARVLSQLRRELEEDAALAGVADLRRVPRDLLQLRT
jgi:4-hydroxymandelate oxidase